MSAGNGADHQGWPERLITVWSSLDQLTQDRLRGPWDKDADCRTRTDVCIKTLRHWGLSLEETIETAILFPDGIGKLHNHPGGIGKFITELWVSQDAEHIQDEAIAEERKRHASKTAAKLFDPWADHKPPSWPSGILSREHEEIIAALCLRDGLDFGAQALAYIAAASGAAPKNARFAPYRHSGWSVPPIVWIMLIADSGQRKTALLNNAFLGLRKINGAHWDDYDGVYARWNAMPDAEKKAHGKPREPHSYIVQDTSPEALQIILAGNDRGTLLLKDELASLFDFGRYSSGTGGSERAFYLESYEGGPYTVHRVGRDRGRIKTCGVTIFGGTQPDRLATFKGLESDGLLQRFCTVVIGPASTSRPDIVVHGKERLDTAIEMLAKLKGRDYTATAKGAELIKQTERDAASFGEITDYGPGFQGYVRKLHGTHARLALILHMLDDPECETIADGTIERAGQLARHFLLPHTRNFYSALPGSTTMATRDLGGWLLTKAKERVLASDITSGVKACRGMGSKPLAELLDPFITGGWLEPEAPFPGNRAWIFDPYLIRTASPIGPSPRRNAGPPFVP
jgi:hypothetical protein